MGWTAGLAVKGVMAGREGVGESGDGWGGWLECSEGCLALPSGLPCSSSPTLPSRWYSPPVGEEDYVGYDLLQVVAYVFTRVAYGAPVGLHDGLSFKIEESGTAG